MRFKIETHPNREMRSVHVDEVLFSGHFGPHYKFSDYQKLDEADRAFVDELVAVKGVVRLYFSPYECSIEKGGVFGWDEVIPPILALFARRYGGLEDVRVDEPPGAHACVAIDDDDDDEAA